MQRWVAAGLGAPAGCVGGPPSSVKAAAHLFPAVYGAAWKTRPYRARLATGASASPGAETQRAGPRAAPARARAQPGQRRNCAFCAGRLRNTPAGRRAGPSSATAVAYIPSWNGNAVFAGAAAAGHARMCASARAPGRAAGGHGCRAGGDDRVIVGQQTAAPAGPRRSDAGQVRLTDRDITGLLLCAEHYAAPYDLLAAAMGAPPARLRGIVARWRTGGVRRRRHPGPRPRVVLAHPRRDGRTGRRTRPPPALAASRTSAPSSPPGCGWNPPGLRRGAGRGGIPSGRIRAALPASAGTPQSRTPRSTGPTGPAAARRPGLGRRSRADRQDRDPDGPDHGRTTAAPPRYAQVVYLTSPAARHVVAGGRRPPARAAGPGRGPRPARRRVRARGVTMAGLLRNPRRAVAAAQADSPGPLPARRRPAGGGCGRSPWPRRLPRPRPGCAAGPRPGCTGLPPGRCR